MKIYSKGSLYATDPKSTLVLYLLQEGFCNMNCKHCYMKFQKRKSRFRDLNSAKKDIKNLILQGYKVNLRGTEILLNPKFLSLFPLAKQNYIQTNGKILYKNNSFFKKIKKAKIKKIILTYPTEPKNIINISKKVVEEVIKIGSKGGFNMIVDFIITKNISKIFQKDSNYFKKLCNKLRSIGAHELRFVRLIPFSKELKKICPSESETKKIIEESVKLESYYKGKFNVTRAGQMGFFDLRRNLKEKYCNIKVHPPEKSKIMDCPGGIKLFIIDLDNKVYPCLYLMNSPYQIGKFINGKIVLRKNSKIPGKLHTKECPAYFENLKEN
ncbi:MAG: hypothetical protein ISS82_01670 [Nanoarchaeota archaeon]|nr:hypothetical protein [Nanoarchaeota archaeon]